MGMNYYLRPSRNPLHWGGNPFPFQPGEDHLHIGKSSMGWCFALHVLPDRGINSLESWKPWLKRHRIQDEYERRVSYRHMMAIITDRSHRDFNDDLHALINPPWDNRRHHTPEQLAANHAQEGPRGLLRRLVDGTHCVGNGQGTWDLMTGDFS
jgi:hypothetical protein